MPYSKWTGPLQIPIYTGAVRQIQYMQTRRGFNSLNGLEIAVESVNSEQ